MNLSVVKTIRAIQSLGSLLAILVAAPTSAYELTLDPHVTEHEVVDQRLWSELKDFPINTDSFAHMESGAPEETLLGRSGIFVAHIKINSELPQERFVVVHANFVDKGKAFWRSENGQFQEIAEFSQLTDSGMPQLSHSQAFPLKIKKNEHRELWIVIQAKQFAVPASLSFMTPSSFYSYQFNINFFTSTPIMAMIILGILSLVIYGRTRQPVTLACAGYVGLHGIGWAAAAGNLNSIFQPVEWNLAYGGMYLFPFAISYACSFARDLFEFNEIHKPLYTFFTWLSRGLFVLGGIMIFLPFTVTFYISHTIASLWVLLSLWIGYKMLSQRDYRAKYFLAGNLFYSAGLIYYIVSHSHLTPGLAYPELVILVALAIDCVCILLSLSEWFKKKQDAYNLSEKLREKLAVTLEFEKQARQEQNNFWAMVSHEFQTPLGTILNSAQAIEQGFEKEPPAALGRIQRATSRLSRLVDKTLVDQWTNATSDQLNCVQLDLGELLQSLSFEYNVPLKSDLQPGQSLVIQGDPSLLSTAISSLLDNALKYGDDREQCYLTVGYQQDGTLCLDVFNSGSEIPEQERLRIFEKFYRSHQHQGVSGGGFGLYITKKIVELHNARIDAISRNGTIFRITFKADDK